MPYRIKSGQEVLVVSGLHLETKTLKREIEFPKERLIASPLPEHEQDNNGTVGKLSRVHAGFPWGFDARKLWEDGPKVTAVYAKEVHMVDRGTTGNVNTVVVKGSSGTPYTLQLDPTTKRAATCTCPGFRYKRTTCKHIEKYNR